MRRFLLLFFRGYCCCFATISFTICSMSVYVGGVPGLWFLVESLQQTMVFPQEQRQRRRFQWGDAAAAVFPGVSLGRFSWMKQNLKQLIGSCITHTFFFLVNTSKGFLDFILQHQNRRKIGLFCSFTHDRQCLIYSFLSKTYCNPGLISPCIVVSDLDLIQTR